MHAERAAPNGGKGFLSYFCALQKVGQWSPQSGEGFNFVCAKPPLRRAESRFGKPREVPKGFNFVRANLLFGCAASRFAEPRISLQGRTVLFFSLVRKERGVPQRFANLWTPGTIQISARFEILAEMTGHHHVTGHTGHCNLPGYRRLGFESVRKVSRTADARLRSFEKSHLSASSQ